MAVIVKYVVERNGEEKMTFTSKSEADAYDKMLDIADELFTFLGESELIEEGDEAKITDLSILTHEDEDITDFVLAEEKVLWIVCYDLSLTSTQHINELNQLVKEAKAEGIKVYGLSSAGKVQKDKFIQENQLDFDFSVTDGIVLKTMVRSNPGIMYLEHGTVKGKSHENDISSLNELRRH